MLAQVPYTIECVYSDNGREYKYTIEHAFVNFCREKRINQKFTKPAHFQTNGKAERVIKTLMEMWHDKENFTNVADRQAKLRRFLNFYNTVKARKGLNGATAYEISNFILTKKSKQSGEI